MTLTDYASLSTIVASLIAVYTLCTWRKHQMYSMHLELLLSLEDQYESLIKGYISVYKIYDNLAACAQLRRASSETSFRPEFINLVAELNNELSSNTQELRIVDYEKTLSKVLRLNLIKEQPFIIPERLNKLFFESLTWSDEFNFPERKAELKDMFEEEFSIILELGIDHIRASRKNC
ncbi:TPA: hypothetical protein ACGUP9_004391 [Vibrio vulnificus]|nr:hypothetical protein [Vibrio vulnificus]